MGERAIVFEVSQLGPETTPGTKVAATKKLLGTRIMPRIMSENNTHRPNGSRWISTAVQNKEWVEADITSDVAQYTDPVYLLAGFVGSPDIAVPGGGTLSRNHTFEVPSFHALTPKTFTVEGGSSVRAGRFGYGLVKSLGMDFKRSGVTLSGNMIGQLYEDAVTLTAGTNEIQTITASGTVSGGTYTISFRGETTSALAYDANNAAILAALNALPNIDSGDVTLGGGALPGTPVTITFGGKYASLDVPLISIDDALLTGSTPAYTPTETTAGVALSELALKPISGKEWDIYVDDTAAGLGSTKLTRCYAASWRINELYGVQWPANTTLTSWAAHVDLAPTTEVRFTVQADAAGMGFRDNLQSGDKVFVRIEATGPIIEGAIPYLSRDDLAVEITGISPWSDNDGVYAIEYTGQIAHDSTWGGAAQFLRTNTVTAIS